METFGNASKRNGGGSKREGTSEDARMRMETNGDARMRAEGNKLVAGRRESWKRPLNIREACVNFRVLVETHSCALKGVKAHGGVPNHVEG